MTYPHIPTFIHTQAGTPAIGLYNIQKATMEVNTKSKMMLKVKGKATEKTGYKSDDR